MSRDLGSAGQRGKLTMAVNMSCCCPACGQSPCRKVHFLYWRMASGWEKRGAGSDAGWFLKLWEQLSLAGKYIIIIQLVGVIGLRHGSSWPDPRVGHEGRAGKGEKLWESVNRPSVEFCPPLAGPGPSVQRGAPSQKECSFSSLGDCTLHWNPARLWLASSPRINFNGHFHSTVLDRNVWGFPAERQKQRPSFHLAVYWPGRWKG